MATDLDLPFAADSTIPTKIERVTFQNGAQKTTVLLEIQRETEGLLQGLQVDREGTPVEPTRAYLAEHNATTGDIVHILDKGLIGKRRPMVMDLIYGYLVPAR